MRIALAGNPNSGKTTMYNALTGRNEKVGNWAGVTVDVKTHPIKKKYYEGDKELLAVDLPGAYSMSPFTSEESITSDYVKNANPDVIIKTYENAPRLQQKQIISMIDERLASNKEVDGNVLVKIGKLCGKDFLHMNEDDE